MKNTKRFFIAPLLLMIIGLLIVGGGVYFYTVQKAKVPTVVNNGVATTTIQTNIVTNSTVPPATIDQSSLTSSVANPTITGTVQSFNSIDIAVTTPDGNGPLWEKIVNVINGGWAFTPSSSNQEVGGEGKLSPGLYSVRVITPDLRTILTQGTLTILAGSGTSPTTLSVPGMSKYTDSSFGFSFWYPSGWKILSVGTGSGSYGDGIIQKTIVVGVDSVHAVRLDEISSRSLSVLIGNEAKSGIDEKYYFDPVRHAWMYATTDFNANFLHPYLSTTTADISNNTMGGLHMFVGQGTFGENIAVPLSATNFIVVETSGAYETLPLMKTILATDPSVATPVSVAQQTATVQAEKDAYAGQ